MEDIFVLDIFYISIIDEMTIILTPFWHSWSSRTSCTQREYVPWEVAVRCVDGLAEEVLHILCMLRLPPTRNASAHVEEIGVGVCTTEKNREQWQGQ